MKKELEEYFFCYIKENMYLCIVIVQNLIAFKYFEHN